MTGGRNRAQATANAQVLKHAMPRAVLAQVTAISDRISAHIPDVGNVFNHYP